MPTTCSDNKASNSSGTPESVVALDWNQWTASPELVDDFIGIRTGDKNKVSIIGRIRRVGEEVVICPLIMGAPSFDHALKEELDVSVDLAWYGGSWHGIFPEDIDEFSLCKDIEVEDPSEWMDHMENVPEAEVKANQCEILGDIPKKDWEGSDHI